MDLADHPDVDRVVADLNHLRDLWDMLPCRRDTEFWEAFIDAVDDHDDSSYFEEKVGALSRDLSRMVEAGRGGPIFDLQQVVQYVFVLFDRDIPGVFPILDRVVNYGIENANVGRAGRRWQTSSQWCGGST